MRLAAWDYAREGFWLTMGSLLGFTLVAGAAALLGQHEAREAAAKAKLTPSTGLAVTAAPSLGGACGCGGR